MTVPTYSGPQACRAVGITYRQLDYWDRAGVVHATIGAVGSGSRRGYDVEALVELKVVADLVAAVGDGGLAVYRQLAGYASVLHYQSVHLEVDRDVARAHVVAAVSRMRPQQIEPVPPTVAAGRAALPPQLRRPVVSA